MNKDLLKQKAEVLYQLLENYSLVNSEAKSVLIGLRELLVSAISGNISSPIEWGGIPGAHQFNEGSLRQYSDLETAFAEFRIEVTGGESLALKAFREKKRK